MIIVQSKIITMIMVQFKNYNNDYCTLLYSTLNKKINSIYKNHLLMSRKGKIDF